MVDAAKQESLVVRSRKKTCRDGRDAQLHFQTLDPRFQKSTAQKERAHQKSNFGTRTRLVNSPCHNQFTNEY
jgi:hypothetical protein